MAANARIDDKGRYSRTNFSTVLSQASYSITLAADNLFVHQAVVDFLVSAAKLSGSDQQRGG